jgi:hypothetical protein
MERIELLHRHLVTTFWTENGWTLQEANSALEDIDWQDCGGLKENVAAFFTHCEKAHLLALCAERIALEKPWFSPTEIETYAELLFVKLSAETKRGLLEVPYCSEYFKAPVH